MERKRRTSPSKRVSPPRVTAKTGLRLLLPFLALTYAVMVWYGRRGKSGAIDFASSHACFGSLDERARERERHSLGEGTGVLENIASAYLIPGRLQGGVCGGRKVVAFAITLTKEGNHMDGAVVLAASIDQACARSEFLCDLVAFVHDDVGLPSENVLRRLGFRVLRPGLPLALTEIEDEWTRQRMEKGGCCGSAELMKFFAYTLTDYHRVVHLDTDVLVLEPLDPILESNMSLLFTEDVNMANPRSPTLPVQGGFMVLRPDLKVFDDLVQIVKSTPYTSGAGWGGSNIGLFWGGVTVQGLLPYYYEQRAPAGVEYRVVDRCEYNNMVDTGECQAVDISTVRTAHFTNCRKPWDCAYPHPKQPLCSRLFERWFEIRAKAEIALGLPPSEACRTGYLSRYSPIPLLPKTNVPKTDAPAVE